MLNFVVFQTCDVKFGVGAVNEMLIAVAICHLLMVQNTRKSIESQYIYGVLAVS